MSSSASLSGSREREERARDEKERPQDRGQLHWSIYSGTRPYAPKRDHERVRNARPVLFQEKYRNDPVLCELLAEYAQELAEILVAVARKLALGDEPFDVVLSGSVLVRGRHPALNNGILANVRKVFPEAKGVVVDRPPVMGALRMARELLEKGASP